VETVPRVMVVDDEPDIRELLILLLQREHFQVESAKNGNDFLKKVNRINPDLVTLDVMMPGPPVHEILKKLKEKKSKPKIILLTVVRFDERKKQQLFELGNVVEYIQKPFEINEFINTVKKHV
jgi:DNA-binding response OmpR family regulator